MFRAIDSETGDSVLSLDLGPGDLRPLRGRGRKGKLRCPVCKGVVILRAGPKRRPHFAHKEIESCPLQNESAERLELRARLYQWLNTKYPGKVGLEEMPDHPGLPGPVDVVVRTDRGLTFAYWVLTRGVRSVEHRAAMSKGLVANGWLPHFVFSGRLLRRVGEDKVDLRPTEREFMRVLGKRLAYRLHYLHAVPERVTTLRTIHLLESPARFRFKARLESPLAEVLLSPKTGELVHPGEREAYQRRQARALQRRKKPRSKPVARIPRPPTPEGRPPAPVAPPPPVVEVPAKPTPRLLPVPPKPRPKKKPRRHKRDRRPQERSGKCKHCGKETTDWIIFDGKTGLCECRECVNRPTR